MILDEIAKKTRERVNRAKQEVSPETMRTLAEEAARSAPSYSPAELPFRVALRGNETSPKPAFICEVKKASPSKGVITEDFSYLSIAKEYEAAGAAAISVLTEPDYFMGCNAYLQEIAAAVKIPVLRKDFIVDSYQIYEAKTIGASAVLLICTLLDTDTLREYIHIAHSLSMEALVEAHTEAEVESALSAGAGVIGVNNRKLQTFEVDITTSIRLRKMVPSRIVFVSESGIRTPEDIAELKNNGTNAVLIGETFMRSADKKKQLEILRSGCK